MNNKEKYCRRLWADIVKLRDSRCVITNQQEIQAHHIFLLSRQPGWPVIFNIDFGVSVSNEIHAELTGRPYGDLFEKVLQRIRQKSDQVLDNFPDIRESGRAELIIKQLNKPQKICPILPDYKQISKKLKRIGKYIEETFWMNRTEDIYPAYGNPVI